MGPRHGQTGRPAPWSHSRFIARDLVVVGLEFTRASRSSPSPRSARGARSSDCSQATPASEKIFAGKHVVHEGITNLGHRGHAATRVTTQQLHRDPGAAAVRRLLPNPEEVAGVSPRRMLCSDHGGCCNLPSCLGMPDDPPFRALPVSFARLPLALGVGSRGSLRRPDRGWRWRSRACGGGQKHGAEPEWPGVSESNHRHGRHDGWSLRLRARGAFDMWRVRLKQSLRKLMTAKPIEARRSA